MATNDEKVEIEAEDIQDFEEPESLLNDSGEDQTDWKAEAIKRDGMARRLQTKLKKLKESQDKAEADSEAKSAKEAKQPQNKTTEKKEFDLAEETYLITKGIKENHFGLVLEEMKSSGKSLKEVINSKYFQEKLETEMSKEALPSDTKRSGGSARNQVEYWLAKGELPPRDGTLATTELRRKIVKARAAQEENTDKFSKTPIVSAKE